MRNLVVCCDGTWNTPEEMDKGLPSPTNVVKLYNALKQDEPEKQLAYYHPGVGTGKGWWDHVVGGGTGEGLDQNILSAYHWLAYNYKPDDRIFLFGFSRGAYTVRSLGGFITKCGLIDISAVKQPSEVWRQINEVFAAYRDEKDFTNPKEYPFHNTKKEENPKEKVPLHFIGVWDTVGALGIPEDLALLGLLEDSKKFRFHDTTLGKTVAHARHAVALDERRASFAPTLWSTTHAETDVKQIWFPGVHGDVGGGYLEAGLSDGALQWMMTEASAESCGLMLRDNAKEHVSPNEFDFAHDSCTGVFKALKTQPRSAPPIPTGAEILHSSVIDRNNNPPLTQGNYWHTTPLAPSKSRVVDISATKQWNWTGFYLEAGRTYRFQAGGEWLDGEEKYTPAGKELTGLHWSDVRHFASSILGEAETAFKSITGHRKVDFWGTRRHEDKPWFALMGFVASSQGEGPQSLATGESFLIGQGTTFKPKFGGYLYCYANDAWHAYGNNRGSVALTITQA